MRFPPLFTIILPLLLGCGQDIHSNNTLQEKDKQPTASIAENLRRKDPKADGWHTEVLHEAVKEPLKEYLNTIFLNEKGESNPLSEIATSSLIPQTLKTIFEGAP